MTSGLWPRWRHRIRLAQPRSAHLLAAALCAGLALSLALPVRGYALAAAAGLLGLAALADPAFRVPLLAAALAAAGLWLGTVRLESIDRSDLVDRIGEIVRARVEVTGQARTSPFTVRVPVRVRRADSDIVDERAQLELRASERAPPQGAILDVYVEVRRPRSATDEDDFDEAGYLRRQGAHVVLEASGYRVVGRRGGVPGAADRLRDALARSIAPGLVGERKALVAGIVLGADEGLDPDLRDRFRASGLYHLLAVDI